MTSGSWELILLLYSALMKSHLQYCIIFWSPQHNKDMTCWREPRPWRVTKRSRGRRTSPMKIVQKSCGSAWRGLQRDLIAAFQYLKRTYKKADRRRRKGFKLKDDRFRLHIKKKFFT